MGNDLFLWGNHTGNVPSGENWNYLTMRNPSHPSQLSPNQINYQFLRLHSSRASIVSITGLRQSGKTTLANRVRRHLRWTKCSFWFGGPSFPFSVCSTHSFTPVPPRRASKLNSCRNNCLSSFIPRFIMIFRNQLWGSVVRRKIFKVV